MAEARDPRPIDLFFAQVERTPDRVAVIGPGRELSYAELAREVESAAAVILERLPGPDSRVGLSAANSVESLIGLLALLAAGKVWVPLNPRNSDRENLRIIDFVSVELLILDEEMEQRIGGSTTVGTVALDALFEGPRRRLERRPLLKRLHAIKFTGGSTGLPKAVAHSWECWIECIRIQLLALELTGADRYLVAAPLTHGAGTYLIPALASGAAIVIPESTGAEALLDAIERDRATFTFLPPTLLYGLVDAQRERERDTSSMRCMIYGGGPVSPTRIAEAQAVFGEVIATTYGQTEAPQIISFLPPDKMRGDAMKSVGYISPGVRVRLVDGEGRVVEEGGIGEICVSGPLLMDGYLGNDAATAETVRDGWLYTGDLGRIEDGILYLEGRRRDLIITGGFNVFPRDVESVLETIPAVAEAAVFGVVDEKWGEAVHAAIRLDEGCALSADELRAAARPLLGGVKTPKAFHFFAEFPRTPVGKVDRTTLGAEVRAAGMAQAR